MIRIPSVRQFMTPAPKTIEADQTLVQASEYMRKLHIRHLPVMKAGRLVGVISDRDISLILTFQELDALEWKVEHAMVGQPFFTSPETPLDQIIQQMADEKVASIMVMDRQKLIGIFTTIDALKALAHVFTQLG